MALNAPATWLFSELRLETALHLLRRYALDGVPEQPFMPEGITQAPLTLSVALVRRSPQLRVRAFCFTPPRRRRGGTGQLGRAVPAPRREPSLASTRKRPGSLAPVRSPRGTASLPSWRGSS